MLLIAASILAARKLAQFDGGKRVPATMSAIADAVRWAEEIMKAIDERWPARRWRCDNQDSTLTPCCRMRSLSDGLISLDFRLARHAGVTAIDSHRARAPKW